MGMKPSEYTPHLALGVSLATAQPILLVWALLWMLLGGISLWCFISCGTTLGLKAVTFFGIVPFSQRSSLNRHIWQNMPIPKK